MPAPAFHSLPSAIAAWAAIQPDSQAALSPRAPALTWREVDAIVASIAASLRGAGVGPEDPVAILLPPSRDAYLLTLAVAAAAIAVPMEAGSPQGELQTLAARVRPVLAIAARGGDGEDRADAALGCPVVEARPGPALPLDPDPTLDRRPRPGPADVALIACTYGDLGDPRLVPLRHGQIVAGGLPLARALGIGPADRWLCLGRPQEPSSWVPAFASVLAGGSMAFPSSLEPSTIAFSAIDLRPTWTVATPAQYDQLLAVLDGTSQESPFRLLVSSGYRLDPALAARMTRVLAAPIVRELGLPETMTFALSPQTPGDTGDTGDTGEPALLLPIGGADVAAAGPDGALLGPGESGELLVRGPQVFPGYPGDASLDAAAFLPGGWFRTGLRGHLAAGGGFHVLGSLAGFIERGGERIDPAEVEAVLADHPDVAAAVVYGVPDDLLGEDARAAIVLRPGATVTPRALRRAMLDRLPVSRVPRRIVFLDAVVESAPGIIDREGTAAAAEAAAEAARLAEARAEAERRAAARLQAEAEAERARLAAEAQPAEDPVFADDRIRGPIRLVAPVEEAGDRYPRTERFSFRIEPDQPIRRIVLRGVCYEEACVGRLVHVLAGHGSDAFVVPCMGAFALGMTASLDALRRAEIAFEPGPSSRKNGKSGKGRENGKSGKGRKNGKGRTGGNPGAAVLPFEVSAIEFEPGG
ncbi:MAG: class I adenylate-forming enzyme family protein [Chloroflexota bacterium]